MQGIAGQPRGTAAKAGVTVVVPAYNAGPYLERCLQSLLEQTLDRSRYDVVVVDDGSTDGTGERLDLVARQHPELFRVEHIPNSGWPGRPRNLGTDLAEREYVFYCDADDWLLPAALEAMLGQAVAEQADILLARPVGNRRRVGLALFERGDFSTTLRETPGVFGTLTCQKLFRRDFLRERDVRFGEGRVRLEDFLFMTAAYLRAERISILGSQPCYVFERRDDGGNLTATRATEEEYFASVEKIIDLIVAEAEPGPQQDQLLDRVLRSELIGPLSRPPLLRKTPAVQAEALEHGRRLLATKVPPSAVARLNPVSRGHVRAIEQGDLAAILRTIEAELSVSARLSVLGVTWQGNAVRLALNLALEQDGQVVNLRHDGSALYLPGALAGAEPTDLSRIVTHAAAHVHVRSRDRSEEWRVNVALTPVAGDDAAPRLEWSATAVFEPFTLASGRPLRAGRWDLHVALTACGFRRAGRVHAAAGVDVGVDPAQPATVGDLRVRPYWTKADTLALAVRTPGATGRTPPPARPRRSLALRIARRLRAHRRT